jgi:hypothetical protein
VPKRPSVSRVRCWSAGSPWMVVSSLEINCDKWWTKLGEECACHLTGNIFVFCATARRQICQFKLFAFVIPWTRSRFVNPRTMVHARIQDRCRNGRHRAALCFEFGISPYLRAGLSWGRQHCRLEWLTLMSVPPHISRFVTLCRGLFEVRRITISTQV